MKTLHYEIIINVNKEQAWDTMLDKSKYNDWANAFSPKSTYEGKFKEGAHVIFTDPDLGGTKALIEVFEPASKILARHVATINKEGVEDTESEPAKKWIGSTEEYQFVETDSGTKLSVTIETHEDFEKMFESSWPKALKLLKEICELS